MINYTQPFSNSRTREKVKTYDPTIEKTDSGKKIVLKERVKDLNEGLSYTDFSLQSLIDADAIDLLQPTSPVQRGQLDAADIANTAANSIGDFANNVKDENKE